MRAAKTTLFLGWLTGLLLLAGCAQSPQYLQVKPNVGQSLPQVGNGQSVTLDVVDGRESDVLGTRSGAAMSTAVISVEAHDLMPKLKNQAEQALVQMGFNPTADTAPGRPSLTLTLTDLSYQKAEGKPLLDKAVLLARFRAVANNDRQSYTGTYTAKREQEYAMKPGREANTNMVSDLLSRALQRTFNDPQIGSQLAR
ncbi:YajG family lipoprotein [Halomonas sp. M20]|uniref:YajG family lipoprotein n=1 Tax=Halomonas sp. M20 TaxID=2763264 RepID=UPI001D0BA897|nr:YajG family lipoprotein [Halomonas sp. M20]